MRRPVARRAEIAGRGNDAASEMVLPDAIDRDARGQWVVGRNDEVSQLLARIRACAISAVAHHRRETRDYRFAFGGIYRLGMFNGDPHPGNYLFAPGGKITFLDFGLCKIFTPDEVAIFERLIRFMVYDNDMEAFAQYSQEIGVLNDATKFSPEEIFAYFSHFYEFVLHDAALPP